MKDANYTDKISMKARWIVHNELLHLQHIGKMIIYRSTHATSETKLNSLKGVSPETGIARESSF